MRRSVVLFALLGGVVAIAAAGYLAGTRVQSAAEIAARKSPPPPSLIMVPVERKVLSTEVITRGTVHFGAPREVTLPSSALRSGSRVVTSAATAGTELTEGDVVMAISGRPLFVLQGAQPVYRDLSPGISGEDVRQLEIALSRLGFDPGAVDGLYDEATSAAVERWYSAAGWSAQGPTPEQIAGRRSAAADARQGSVDVLDAEESVRAARAMLDLATAKMRLAEVAVAAALTANSTAATNHSRDLLAATADVSRFEGVLRVAVEEVRAAEMQFAEARDGITTPATLSELVVLEAEVNSAASLVTLAQAEVESGRAATREAKLAANAESAAKRRALDDALRADPSERSTVENARAELAAAESRAEAVGSAGIADAAVRQRAVDAASANLGAARARLNDARIGKTVAASPAELAAKTAALLAAKTAMTAATNDLRLARAVLSSPQPPGPDGVAAATIELEGSRLEVNSARVGLQIAERRAGLAGGRQALPSGSTAQIGFQVPADEVLFFPALPLRVSSVTVRVGDRAEGSLLTVTNSRLVVSGAISGADAKVVQAGALVRIDATELGVAANGSVATVAQSPGTQGVDAQRFYIEITPENAPAAIVGASVVITVSVKSTNGEVLVVPVAALSVAADGTSLVQVRSGAGTVTPVAVRPGLAARGLVEVTPLTPGLAAGDLVVVGAPTQGASVSK